MSVKTLRQQSNRCTLAASDLSRTLKISRAAEVSVAELSEDYLMMRGRSRNYRQSDDTQLHQSRTQRITEGELSEGLSELSPVYALSAFRPTFTLPPTTRRCASPDSQGQRAATPHPRKATLPRSGSSKIIPQPALSFRAAGLVSVAACRWNHEDYKHELHLNWLNRS